MKEFMAEALFCFFFLAAVLLFCATAPADLFRRRR